MQILGTCPPAIFSSCSGGRSPKLHPGPRKPGDFCVVYMALSDGGYKRVIEADLVCQSLFLSDASLKLSLPARRRKYHLEGSKDLALSGLEEYSFRDI